MADMTKEIEAIRAFLFIADRETDHCRAAKEALATLEASVATPVLTEETSYVVPGKTLRHLVEGCELFRELLEDDDEMRELIDVEVEWLTAARASIPSQPDTAAAVTRAAELALLERIDREARDLVRDGIAGGDALVIAKIREELNRG